MTTTTAGLFGVRSSFNEREPWLSPPHRSLFYAPPFLSISQLSACLFLCLSACLFLSLSFFLSPSLSLCLCSLSLSLSPSLSFSLCVCLPLSPALLYAMPLPRRGRTLAGAELLYASLFCNGDVDVARTSLTFKASSSLRGNRRFDFGYRLGAASVLLVRASWLLVARSRACFVCVCVCFAATRLLMSFSQCVLLVCCCVCCCVFSAVCIFCAVVVGVIFAVPVWEGTLPPCPLLFYDFR